MGASAWSDELHDGASMDMQPLKKSDGTPLPEIGTLSDFVQNRIVDKIKNGVYKYKRKEPLIYFESFLYTKLVRHICACTNTYLGI